MKLEARVARLEKQMAEYETFKKRVTDQLDRMENILTTLLQEKNLTIQAQEIQQVTEAEKARTQRINDALKGKT